MCLDSIHLLLSFCPAVRVSIAGNDNSAVRVHSGQNMSMGCSAVNLPTGITVRNYHWTLMSRETRRELSSVDGVTLHGSHNESLVIPSLSYIHHLGDYQCGMTLSTGEQYNSNIITLTPSRFTRKSIIFATDPRPQAS